MGNAKLKATKTERIKNIEGGTKAVWVSEFKIETEKTLRDEFAVAALQGLVAHPSHVGDASAFAVAAYEFADAMLKAREPEKCT